MTERRSHWVRRTLVVLGTVAVVLLIAARWVYVKVEERYSRGFVSASSADAESRGLLQSRPIVTPVELTYLGDSLRILDAWVEQATHLEYKWYLLRREVREPRFRLLLVASADWRPNYRCREGLYYADTISFGSHGQDQFFDERPTSDFPDTVRLSVQRRGGC